jgi:hypothetical protein
MKTIIFMSQAGGETGRRRKKDFETRAGVKSVPRVDRRVSKYGTMMDTHDQH